MMGREGDHDHAASAQRFDGLDRQVGVGSVDDCEVGEAGAGCGDDLGQVGAAPDDGEGLRSPLNRLDEGCLVALIGQDDDPVYGAHGSPTGTAANSSVEDCAARRTGMDWALARISIRWPRRDWDESSIRRTKVKVPSISRA